MTIRSQRIIAVIIAVLMIGIAGYISRHPIDFQLDFAWGPFEVYSAPVPAWLAAWVPLLCGLSMAVPLLALFLALWRRHRKQH